MIGAAAFFLAAAAQVQAVVLGVVQDGGVPHLGCTRELCEAARRDPSKAERVASLGLIAGSRIFLIDATPDFRSQVDTLRRLAGEPAARPVDGILLTHAHIGHYTGLMYLGKESMAARRVPVHASRRMSAFLTANGPWRRLVAGEHIELRGLHPGRSVELAAGLSVEPLRVAHREEESDALGFLVKGPGKRLLYIPDIDAWQRWNRDIADLVASADVALLDGTFYGPGELEGRSMEDIPHPFITDTMDRLEPLIEKGRRVIFIHLNHTNPALRLGSPQRRAIERRGFEVATDGLSIEL